jgi:hypothetical protein
MVVWVGFGDSVGHGIIVGDAKRLVDDLVGEER